MKYNYQTEKEKLYSDEGLKLYVKTRDRAFELLNKAGAFMMQNIFTSGNTWEMMACIDRMVETGELKEITNGNVAGQHRVFIRK